MRHSTVTFTSAVPLFSFLVSLEMHTTLQTIAAVGQPQFTVDLSGVTAGRTRGLLEGLLNPDPKKRLKYFDSVSCRMALL